MRVASDDDSSSQAAAPTVTAGRALTSASVPPLSDQNLNSAMGRLLDRVDCGSVKEMFMARLVVRGICQAPTHRRRVWIPPALIGSLTLAAAHWHAWSALIRLF